MAPHPGPILAQPFLNRVIFFFLLEDNCLTILCWFLLYNMNQS